jgi:hypothetical protein
MRKSERGLTAVEAAMGVALLGAVLAAAIPACVREMHASRFAEPVNGLDRLGKGAVAHAESSPRDPLLSAPLTPPSVPRGKMETDPPGTWDHPTWRALDFRASPEGVAHAFSFEVQSSKSESTSELVARAHGDLDGDGQTSTFEIRVTSDANGARVVPGMYVEAEVE